MGLRLREGGTEARGSPGPGWWLRLSGADHVGVCPKAAQPAAEPQLST